MPSNPITPERWVRCARESPSPDPQFEADECACIDERRLTTSRSFVVAPAAGGGWRAWKASYLRLMQSLAAGPAHCVILTQEPNLRYGQLIIGHDGVRIEVSSNYYLTGDHELGPSEERRLARLGFRRDKEIDPDEDRPMNWWIQQRPAHPLWIAELVVDVLVEVAAFDRRWPVTINVFGKDDPCLPCTWGDLTWTPMMRLTSLQGGLP